MSVIFKNGNEEMEVSKEMLKFAADLCDVSEQYILNIINDIPNENVKKSSRDILIERANKRKGK